MSLDVIKELSVYEWRSVARDDVISFQANIMPMQAIDALSRVFIIYNVN
jgi:hypothetical protein